VTAPPTAARLPGGDGLRAVAASIVFFHHIGFLTGATFNSRIGPLLARFDVGVSIFFALSGFLLSRPYLIAILEDRPLPERRSFYERRIRRIVPAYWVALTATYVWLRPASAALAKGLDYPLHYLFLQIYPGGTLQKGISPGWTLAVEITFYASLPLLALAGARLVRGVDGVSQRAVLLLAGLTVLALLSNVWRGVIYGAGLPTQAVLWLPGMIDQFAVGVALAVIAVWADRRAVARPLADALGRHDLLWWIFAGGLLVFASNQLGLVTGLRHTTWDRELARHAIYTAVGGLMLLPVAFGPQDRGVVRWFLQAPPIAALGIVSYGFFLWHVPLIETAIHLTGQEVFLDWRGGVGFFSGKVVGPTLLAFVLTVIAATCSWFLVEKPLLRGRRRVVEQAAP
jgi:peptidoglycan/LPS O-acetylase OafA/YrhL